MLVSRDSRTKEYLDQTEQRRRECEEENKKIQINFELFNFIFFETWTLTTSIYRVYNKCTISSGTILNILVAPLFRVVEGSS
jgi:hypothetical protein